MFTRSDVKFTALQVLGDLSPNTIRCLLGLGSLLWAFSLMIGPHTFDRQGWSVVSYLCSEESIWALLFFIHGIATFWRLCEPRARPDLNWAITAYGFFIWFFTTLAGNIAIGALSPYTSMEWVMIMAQGWLLLPFKKKRESGTE